VRKRGIFIKMKARTKWGKSQKRKLKPSKVKIDGDNVELTGPFSNAKIAELFNGKSIDSASFHDFKFIDKAAAECVATAASIKFLHLWDDITRPALNKLILINGLIDIYTPMLIGPGRLRDFEQAHHLEIFRSFYHNLTNADFIEISKLPKLHTLIAHGANIGVKAIENIQAMPTLRVVDFEGVNFTDKMANSLAKSTSITDVIVPATQLSTTGLKYINQMPQLRYLDIWANGFTADDLDVLIGHPSLEKLEIGSMDSESPFRLKAADVIPKLEKMPALKEVYFENVDTTEEEHAYLSSRYKFRLLMG
jgi:hypothetical protein